MTVQAPLRREGEAAAAMRDMDGPERDAVIAGFRRKRCPSRPVKARQSSSLARESCPYGLPVPSRLACAAPVLRRSNQ